MKLRNYFFYVICSCLLTATVSTYSQAPLKFNYQAVARDVSGDMITNQNISVRIAIIQGTANGTVLWEEEHSVTTNDFGLFTLLIGDLSATKVNGSLTSFSDIEWSGGPLFLRPSVEYQSTWHEMTASQIVSVPYALLAREAEIGQLPVNGDTLYLPDGSLAIGTDSPGGSRLSVVGSDDLSEDALFEVKRNDGQTVFAVYPEGVRMYVASGSTAKGPKGGFAIGGFDQTKAGLIEDLLWVTPDSIRMYIDDTNPAGKGPKGGFAIGGFDNTKASSNNEYLTVSGKTEVTTVDSASQILWYPLKDALLAGTVHIGSPDSVGFNSVSLGFMNTALGQYSQSLGYKSQTYGYYSTSIGFNAICSYSGSTAIGYQAKADSTYSYALGMQALASGYKSYAFGYLCNAIGDKSYAIGSQNRALGGVSYAIGHSADALENSSMAFGRNAQASGYHSIAIGVSDDAGGYWTDASGTKSVAIGTNCKSQQSGSTTLGFWLDNNDSQSTVVGKYNLPVSDGTVFLVGNGTSDVSRSNAMSVYENGNVTIAGVLTESSDARLKTNITSLGDVLTMIDDLNPVYYEFIDQESHPDDRQIGILAQELQPVFPELVIEDESGNLSVNYSKLSVILLKATQEQKEIIDQKNCRIDALESENNLINSRLDRLESLVNSFLQR
ncbi:MAG TPA: tail fiber domain-containing protein [Bacteroidales bacterium]|nr:tail fiber domain-containing protein [Bacteroidales bacterium]